MVKGRMLAALGAVVLALALMAPGAAEEPARKAASLRMTINGGYSTYVGGQGLTLSGQLPKAGVRKIWLERHMNRPGDAWTKVEDLPYRGTTRADGSFTLPIHAPDMVGLSYRVRGARGGGATPAVTFNPRTQDVTLTVLDPLDLGGIVVVADTMPDHVFGRPDLRDLPRFLGRDLTLQERTGPTEWATISRTQVGLNGLGTFAPFVESAGEHVYRVRMEDWKQDGSDIGWQASFPTYVDIGGLLPGARSRSASPAPAAPVSGRAVTVTGTGASKYGWYPVLWGFDWEEGQDLDSPPKNGVKKGRWIQYTDGAGRVGKHNGGIRLDSGRRLTRYAEGDFGTTRATLTGNADAYGRWETRMRIKTFEAGSKDYDVVLELVPENASDYDCGRQNITVARYSGSRGQMTFGVNARNARWTKTIQAPSLANSIPAFAVEVAKDHIAWFVNGKPVGVVRSRAAVSDVPMTMRFSLVGDQSEHKNTSVYSDWQRHFGIARGTQVKKGPSLAKSALTACVDRR